MKKIKGFDLRVLAALLTISVVLGVLNNLLVFDEQRVKWFGGPVIEAED